MKRTAQKWNLTYTDVINFCTQRIVPILESPSGKVAEKLEQHRLEGEARKTQRRILRQAQAPRVLEFCFSGLQEDWCTF